jgi:hypothetical protein
LRRLSFALIVCAVAVSATAFPLHAGLKPFESGIQREVADSRIKLQYCELNECHPIGPPDGQTKIEWIEMKNYCASQGMILSIADTVMRSIVAAAGLYVGGSTGLMVFSLSTALPSPPTEGVEVASSMVLGLISENEFRLPPAEFLSVARGITQCHKLYQSHRTMVERHAHRCRLPCG